MSKDADAAAKQEVLDWVQAVIGRQLPKEPFEKLLKDGLVLCELINKLKPGSVKRVNKAGSNFQLMENVAAYQKAVKKYGVPDEEIFQTADLFEARNIKQVVIHLYALGRCAQVKGFTGPVLGPKQAEENIREFDEEQQKLLREGQIGLQAGYAGGASQAGTNIGKARGVTSPDA